jgi:U1 small nuclear ribonucleoprotein
MTDKLPPNLLALFAPRPPLRWVPPSDHAPAERKTATISGVAAFLPALEEYKATDKYVPTESWLQRKDRVQLEKKQRQEKLMTDGPLSCEDGPICFDFPYFHSPTSWMSCSMNSVADIHMFLDKPNEDPNIRGDAFKTLIVARLSYDATEQDLEREFGRFGAIERVSSEPTHKLSNLTRDIRRSELLLTHIMMKNPKKKRRNIEVMHS